jgi:transposase
MARPKVHVDEKVIAQANEALSNLKHIKEALQLKAIIASGTHPVEHVAAIFQTTPRSIHRWVNRFKKDGLAGLRDKPKGHLASKLTDQEKRVIEQWIVTSTNADHEEVHWTLSKLQAEVFRIYGITIGTTALWHHLRSMKLALKRPRPVHHKADPQAQEDCKKN